MSGHRKPTDIEIMKHKAKTGAPYYGDRHGGWSARGGDGPFEAIALVLIGGLLVTWCVGG